MLEDTQSNEVIQEVVARVAAVQNTRLLVVAGAGSGTLVAPVKPIKIGRDVDNDIQFSDPNISRHHAVIRDTDGRLEVVDNSSRNGTRVNGELVTRRSLDLGDVVQFGRSAILITAADEYADKLREVQRLAVVGRLAMGIAHDFNNTLTAVIANADHLASKPLDADSLECIADMQAGCTHAAALARQLLNQTAPTGQFEVLNPVFLARDVVALAKRSLHQTASVVVRSRAGLRVRGDRGQLWQVLLNVILNANEAVDEGERVQIEVTFQRRRSTGAQRPAFVVIQIRDDGAGIPEAILPRVFEPFITTRAGRGGTGLGLAMVRDIVSAHGGTVEITSTVGEGTCVEVCLPEARTLRDVAQTAELKWPEGDG